MENIAERKKAIQQDELKVCVLYTFDLLSKEVQDTAKAKGWWGVKRSDGELIALMHSELSEALEYLRAGNPPDDKVPEHNGAVVELADCIIRILDTCKARQWPIGEALLAKLAYNRSRPHRHGGKKF